MTEFKFGDNLRVECWAESTRSGFRHIAVLYKDGCEIDRTKVCYLNRTWESFEFETVLNKLTDRNEDLKLFETVEKL